MYSSVRHATLCKYISHSGGRAVRIAVLTEIITGHILVRGFICPLSIVLFVYVYLGSRLGKEICP